MTVSSPIKKHGGKYGAIAKKIVQLMPPHTAYLEPYCGSAAVLFARDPDDPRFVMPEN
jgi:DNA adenine methylase